MTHPLLTVFASLRTTPAAMHPALAVPFGQLVAAAALDDGVSLATDVYRRSIENLIYVDGGHPDDQPNTATRNLLKAVARALESSSPYGAEEQIREAIDDYLTIIGGQG